MRHARLTPPLPIGTLAPAVILLAYRRGLVSATRCPHLLVSHSRPATNAAIALAAITARTDGKKRVACWVEASPHAKAFDSLTCCHHLNRISQQMIGQMTAPPARMMSSLGLTLRKRRFQMIDDTVGPAATRKAET